MGRRESKATMMPTTGVTAALFLSTAALAVAGCGGGGGGGTEPAPPPASANAKPTVQAIANQSLTIGDSVEVTVSVSDTDTNDTHTLSASVSNEEGGDRRRGRHGPDDRCDRLRGCHRSRSRRPTTAVATTTPRTRRPSRSASPPRPAGCAAFSRRHRCSETPARSPEPAPIRPPAPPTSTARAPPATRTTG